jgi:hypothetical protein
MIEEEKASAVVKLTTRPRDQRSDYDSGVAGCARLRHLPVMSTLTEIEAAVETLPLEQKEELLRFLAARMRPMTEMPPSMPTDLSAFDGVLTLREEPMDYQNRVRSEWP